MVEIMNIHKCTVCKVQDLQTLKTFTMLADKETIDGRNETP